MQIERTVVHEPYILEAILGARLSYASDGRSDSYLAIVDHPHRLVLGEDDERLVRRLLQEGSGADKFLRAIPVSAVVEAPTTFWRQLDQYKVGTVSQSESLMHRVARRGLLTRENFAFSDADWEDPRVRHAVDTVNAVMQEWADSGGRRNSRQSELWERWQKLVPAGFLYRRHWVANYAVLRLILRQRQHHRLSTEWGPFCAWAEQLPFAQLLLVTN